MDETREIEVERLVLREPKGGRVRAVLETVPVESKGFSVRLRVLDPMGDPAFVAEVDHEGQAMLHVGHPNQGTTVTVTSSAVDVWKDGDVVASLIATASVSSD